MPWSSEDYMWLGETFETIGFVCLIFGVAFPLVGIGLKAQLRKKGWTDKQIIHLLLRTAFVVFIAVPLAGASLMLAFRENSPLSRGNKWARASEAAAFAYGDGKYREAEAFERAALGHAELLEAPDGRVCKSISQLRLLCAAQNTLAEAAEFHRRLLANCANTGRFGQDDRVYELVRTTQLLAAGGNHVANREYVEAIVICLAGEIMSVGETQITRTTSIIDDLHADELDLVELVMELEDHFDIAIPDEAIEEFNTIQSVVDHIHKMLASSP